MKRLLTIVLSLLCCVGSFAEEKQIKLEKGNKDHEEKRSLVCEPTATIDGSCISIYSDVAMTMTVSIYDAGNQLVQQLPLLCVGEENFTLTSLLPGEYRIEISCGEELYYGWFTLY